MSARFTLLTAVALVGCGGSSTADTDTSCPVPNHVGCAQPRGTYHISYNERRGGTCGSKAPLTTVAPNLRVTSFSPPCSGAVTWSADFCVASFEVACPEEETGPGFTNKQVSQTNYSDDGMSANGVYELSIFDADGNLFCESTYDKHSLNSSCE
jgi:hypothetical protein